HQIAGGDDKARERTGTQKAQGHGIWKQPRLEGIEAHVEVRSLCVSCRDAAKAEPPMGLYRRSAAAPGLTAKAAGPPAQGHRLPGADLLRYAADVVPPQG